MQNIYQNFKSFYLNVYHSGEHFGGWESSISSKLAISLSDIVDVKSIITINHSMLKKLQNFKMD